MLYINSFASAIGPTDAAALFEADAGTEQGCASILRADYIRETRNVDPARARENMELSPAALAARAARKALERAGLTLDQIGLILADTTTPLELIPSEAQRIAKELGAKVASFDVNTAGVGLPVLFEMLLSWKQERLAAPILCISVHAPTLCVDFSQADAGGCRFGDAAVAAVVSRRRLGFELVRAVSVEMEGGSPRIEIPVNGHLTVSDSFLGHVPAVLQTLSDLFKKDEPRCTIAATFGAETPDACISSYTEVGAAFGASIGVSLESQMESFIAGDRIVALVPGAGMRSGGFLVTRV